MLTETFSRFPRRKKSEPVFIRLRPRCWEVVIQEIQVQTLCGSPVGASQSLILTVLLDTTMQLINEYPQETRFIGQVAIKL